MTYLNYLKKNRQNKDCRWIVKKTNDNNPKIREVKLVYNPKEYKGRTLYNQNQLIKILENDKIQMQEMRKN